jgi:hypothetical protein
MSAPATVSPTMTAAATSPAVTVTGSGTMTMSLAVSNTGTGTVAGSRLPSQTGTSSNAPKALLAVTNVQNFCPAEKQIACLVWNDPIGHKYNRFEVSWRPINGGTASTLSTGNRGATIVGLKAASTYTVTVTGIASTGSRAPVTTITVTTAADRFQGIKNANCRKAGTAVVCKWNNGTTRYNDIKLIVKCQGSKRIKVIIPAGRNQYRVNNAGNNCEVEMVPRYVNGKTQKFNFNI